MSKGFSINDILGSTKTNAPAGQKMQVVMLPAADIEPNPENSIYEIGDVSMLKADIAERGLRSPLEVLPARGGRYMLIAGHRRWTACRALTAEGVAGFEVLPCVIRQSQGEDDDLIALITSNATARELTDGERLRQYRALKQALERKKAAGALDGRIRDEMSRITGDGTGTLGRLNAIANNCVPEVIAMVERSEITMTRAYECSKLYKVQQVEYAKNKYASMPPITDMARRAAIKYLVECGLADQLKKLEIGVDEKSVIAPMENPFRHKIVVHGSSITHGIAAGRAGMAYSSRLGRDTGLYCINLGFSGQCTMQPEFASYLSRVEADAFVFDCFSNPSAEVINERFDAFVDTIRRTHPTTPLIFLQTIRRETRNFSTRIEKFEREKQAAAEAQVRDRMKTDKNIYFVDPGDLLGSDHIATADGTHPTDLGFTYMLDRIEPQIRKILGKYGIR